MQQITPMLWFDKEAEEAAKLYCSVFKNSKILGITRNLEGGGGGAKGDVLTVQFRLGDQEYIALNGGPHFKFSEAISFSIDCRAQDEVDRYWDALTADGGSEQPCGWLKDKFGVSWQVNPAVLGKMLEDPDPQKAQRVMEAMLKMKKIDIAALQRAYAG
jgi:predicted 3-demethylubiquinone-9 3-methyltransferase (glyoxalase superfamily)